MSKDIYNIIPNFFELNITLPTKLIINAGPAQTVDEINFFVFMSSIIPVLYNAPKIVAVEGYPHTELSANKNNPIALGGKVYIIPEFIIKEAINIIGKSDGIKFSPQNIIES